MYSPMKSFVVLARSGSFTTAAKILNLTQTAVSKQIQSLEAELHMTLFVRMGKKGVKLTSEGERILPRIERHVSDIDHMFGRGLQGNLQIGAMYGAQFSLMPSAISRIETEHEKINVVLHSGSVQSLEKSVVIGQIDAAVITRPPDGIAHTCDWVPLLEEPYAVIAPEKMEGTYEQVIAAHSFIRYNRFSYGGRIASRFLAERNIVTRDKMELDELPIIVKMVESGVGVSLIPFWMAMTDINARVRIIPLGRRTLYREVGMLRLKTLNDDALQVMLRDTLLDEATRFAERCRRRWPQEKS